MSWLLNTILPIILEWLLGKAAALFAAFKRKEEIQQEAAKDTEKLEKAETPKEREDAAKNIANHF